MENTNISTNNTPTIKPSEDIVKTLFSSDELTSLSLNIDNISYDYLKERWSLKSFYLIQNDVQEFTQLPKDIQDKVYNIFLFQEHLKNDKGIPAQLDVTFFFPKESDKNYVLSCNSNWEIKKIPLNTFAVESQINAIKSNGSPNSFAEFNEIKNIQRKKNHTNDLRTDNSNQAFISAIYEGKENLFNSNLSNILFNAKTKTIQLFKIFDTSSLKEENPHQFDFNKFINLQEDKRATSFKKIKHFVNVLETPIYVIVHKKDFQNQENSPVLFLNIRGLSTSTPQGIIYENIRSNATNIENLKKAINIQFGNKETLNKSLGNNTSGNPL